MRARRSDARCSGGRVPPLPVCGRIGVGYGAGEESGGAFRAGFLFGGGERRDERRFRARAGGESSFLGTKRRDELRGGERKCVFCWPLRGRGGVMRTRCCKRSALVVGDAETRDSRGARDGGGSGARTSGRSLSRPRSLTHTPNALDPRRPPFDDHDNKRTTEHGAVTSPPREPDQGRTESSPHKKTDASRTSRERPRPRLSPPPTRSGLPRSSDGGHDGGPVLRQHVLRVGVSSARERARGGHKRFPLLAAKPRDRERRSSRADEWCQSRRRARARP